MYKSQIILQIVLSVFLVISILMQSKGMGLSETFGGRGAGNLYSSKRGIEKLLSIITIISSILFIGNATLIMILY